MHAGAWYILLLRLWSDQGFSRAGVMTARNSALAGQLLQALYSAALDAAGPDMQARLRTALAACFERAPSEPAYVAALQRIALADRGAAGSVAIPAVAAAAKASGGLQAGVLQVGMRSTTL